MVFWVVSQIHLFVWVLLEIVKLNGRASIVSFDHDLGIRIRFCSQLPRVPVGSGTICAKNIGVIGVIRVRIDISNILESLRADAPDRINVIRSICGCGGIDDLAMRIGVAY